MPLYDLMLLLDPTAPSDRHEAILKEVTGMLESSGSIRGDYDWGTRRMAFEIDHRPEAAYHLVQFETAPGGELLERIDHTLKIMDGVLRHRIIRLKDGAPEPPMPRPEGRRDYEPAPEAITEGAPAEAAAPEAAQAEPEAVPAEPAATEAASPSPPPEAPEPEPAPEAAEPAPEPAAEAAAPEPEPGQPAAE